MLKRTTIFRISPDSALNLVPMSYQEISREIEEYINNIFESHPNKNLVYHNITHTRNVVIRTIEIASYYKLDEESLFILKAAAWFHDTGYIFRGPNNHEQESVNIMMVFLHKYDLSPRIIDQVEQIIMATKLPTSPVSLSEMIICDADTFHFGTIEFKRTDELVKKEIELRTGLILIDWVKHTIAMLQNHRFYTSYCAERLEKGKMQNIAWLLSLL
jgi:predicted metal-dependent HD superfamily phosphohydrolase